MLTVLIVVAITTLCICDVAVLGLVASYIYDHGSRSRSAVKAPASIPEPGSSGQNGGEELTRAQRDYIARERAFESMMNYNIEQAYGMQQMPTEELENE